MKKAVREIVIVEGRDDTAAVKRAGDIETIETHGFGIRPETLTAIARAQKEKGIIIFTDPDHAGEMIRRKLAGLFPEAKHAHMIREEAKKKGDIGIENASPEAILAALDKAKATREMPETIFTREDMLRFRLVGDDDAANRRQTVGRQLGIGYANAGAFLKKLNKYGITREEFHEAILTCDHCGAAGCPRL